MQFSKPDNLSDAYSLLASDNWKILSGGTDFYPTLGNNPVNFNVLDISGIPALRNIERTANGDWHIGALVTWTDIVKHDLPSAFDGLKLAAREVGSIQIQNRATVVGNICNASPAADGVPPLLTLGAVVKIGSEAGERELPLDQFVTGNRRTSHNPNEVVLGLRIPAACSSGFSNFQKLGARKYLVISISMLAARLVADDNGIIKDAGIAIGSCSAVATRLPQLEKTLISKQISENFTAEITNEHFELLSPIDDVRATASYRMDASRELVIRTLKAMARTFG